MIILIVRFKNVKRKKKKEKDTYIFFLILKENKLNIDNNKELKYYKL